MLVSDFDFHLPPELIAQTPPKERGASRMLVVKKEQDVFFDDVFANFPSYFGPGDCLVLNNTKVFPARLHGRRNRRDGAEVELFLVRQSKHDPRTWRALARPGKRTRPGDTLLFSEDLQAEVIEAGDFGERTVRFLGTNDLEESFLKLGSVPLPPYIRRQPNAQDLERYQTVFAERSGSVAAPTAGLHFTPEILAACRSRGIETARVTLHVGLGTFAPLRAKEVEQVQLHEEYFEIDEAEAAKLNRAKRLACVGTTTVRTIETAMQRGGFTAMQGETNLFISPGFSFKGTGALLTNFHLPQSSLLILVSAFGGRELILRAYEHAVRERYRFFSYGDCMLVV